MINNYKYYVLVSDKKSNFGKIHIATNNLIVAKKISAKNDGIILVNLKQKKEGNENEN